jgi:hypothetical protein
LKENTSMSRHVLLALALALTTLLTSAVPLPAAPPRSGSRMPRPAGPNNLKWEIIGYKRGGARSVRTFEVLTGDEWKAQQEVDWWQRYMPDYHFAYRLAR